MMGEVLVEFVALLLFGFAVGAFGTLVGVGGGFVIVPTLLLLYPHKSADTVTAMSLLVVAANAASGSIAYARQRRIDVRSGLLFALATVPGATLGALVVHVIPRRQFTLLFATALVVIGIWLLLPRNVTEIRAPLTGRGVMRRLVRDREGQTFLYSYRLWQGLAISMVAGFVSSLLGIGGGIVQVPAMAMILHFPVHIAAATSQFVLMLMAAEATGVHLATGALEADGSLAQAATIAAGAVAGAQIGARFALRLRGEAIVRVLGVAMILVAARLGLSAL